MRLAQSHSMVALATLFLAFFLPLRLSAAEEGKLHPQLEPLRAFLGKTWRGEFVNSTPEKPVIDVSHWERVLNGMAVRITHSINDGAYGGETLIYWDETAQSLSYDYFTTAGFRTHGTLTATDGKFASVEKVTGDADGVTEVRASGELGADGTLHTDSQYLKEGKWLPGHSAIYHEAPDAKVVFR